MTQYENHAYGVALASKCSVRLFTHQDKIVMSVNYLLYSWPLFAEQTPLPQPLSPEFKGEGLKPAVFDSLPEFGEG